jgi:hypothetical protein
VGKEKSEAKFEVLDIKNICWVFNEYNRRAEDKLTGIFQEVERSQGIRKYKT